MAESFDPQAALRVGPLSKLLDVTRQTISRWDRDGKLPRPATIGRLKLWRRADIDLWLRLGCPSRKAFTKHVTQLD
jgi:excisionase family DNA binding protein